MEKKEWRGDNGYTFQYCPCCGTQYVTDNSSDCPNCSARTGCREGYYLHLPKTIDQNGKKVFITQYYDPADLEQKSVTCEEFRNFPYEKKKRLLTLCSTYDSYSSVLPYNKEEQIRTNFEYMRLVRQKQFSDRQMDLLDRELDAISETTETVSGDRRADITGDAEKTKAYLKHLINIESDIIAVKRHLAKLFCEKESNEEALTQIEYKAEAKRIKELNRKLSSNASDQHSLTSWGERAFYLKEIWDKKPPKEPTPPTKPELKTAGLFNKKKIQAENEAALSEYNRLMENYQKKKESYERGLIRYKEEKKLFERRVAEQKKKAPSAFQSRMKELKEEQEQTEKEIAAIYDQAALQIKKCGATEAKAFLDNEIQSSIQFLRELVTARKNLYALNIVYEKYRDLVSISAFYDYLNAGRVYSLQGPDGAYNLYESEIRSNQVISQLSSVLTSLEEIKANQIKIYQTLSSVNQQLGQLNTKMNSAISCLMSIQTSAKKLDAIAENTEMIAYNTARTAFFAEKNVELTEALTFLTALK